MRRRPVNWEFWWCWGEELDPCLPRPEDVPDPERRASLEAFLKTVDGQRFKSLCDGTNYSPDPAVREDLRRQWFERGADPAAILDPVERAMDAHWAEKHRAKVAIWNALRSRKADPAEIADPKDRAEYEAYLAEPAARRRAYEQAQEEKAARAEAMEKAEKGLSCWVLRPAIGDCSNGGITSEVDSVVLLGEGVGGKVVPDYYEPALRLVRREIDGVERLHAEPLEPPKLGWDGWTFGGNYITAHDERFPNPIPVHDRQENPEIYKGPWD